MDFEYFCRNWRSVWCGILGRWLGKAVIKIVMGDQTPITFNYAPQEKMKRYMIFIIFSELLRYTECHVHLIGSDFVET